MTSGKEDKVQFKGKYFYGVGKRKTSVATVRLYPKGKGNILINEKSPVDYFPTAEVKAIALAPLQEVEGAEKFDLSIRVKGGGFEGQAEAVRHGIAKALVDMNHDLKPVLKAQGFLTRDARIKERKKPGLKKARRAPQWSKR